MASVTLTDVCVDYPRLDSTEIGLKRVVLDMMLRRPRRTVTVRAIDGISLTARPGERIGLYGHNGSGKSTLLRTIAGIFPPASGAIEVEGRTTLLLGFAAGIRPDLSAIANVEMLLRLVNVDPRPAILDRIWRFAELPDEYRTAPLKSLSSGMQMRVLFAVSTFSCGDILLLDEWLSVTDDDFRAKAEHHLQTVLGKNRILFVASHDWSLLSRVATRILVLDHGRIAETVTTGVNPVRKTA